jgi:hypothetical protein
MLTAHSPGCLLGRFPVTPSLTLSMCLINFSNSAGWRCTLDCMAISEFETKRREQIVLRYLDGRRPSPHIRSEVDLDCRVLGQSVEMFEIRQVWKGKPGEKMEHPFAKATYVKSKAVWKIYWQRADLKWHRYEPSSEVKNLEEFLAVVEKDEHGCFYG